MNPADVAAAATLEEHLSAAEAGLLAAEANYNEALDTIWMILAGLLVFFMHAGFSFLEAGFVRCKNVQNILAKNLIVATASFLSWWSIGYAIALGHTGESSNQFLGTMGFFMDGFWEDRTMFRFWFFQGAFCATAPTIVSGAMAERVQIKGFAIFIAIMTGFIYPVVVYWCWSGHGFLNYKDDAGEQVSILGSKYLDFAGSGVVHMVGGIGALCGALVVGPRKGRFEKTKEEDEFYPHNIPFCVLGTFCLWVGWFGFNPGSTLEMHTAKVATRAGLSAVNSVLAPCASGLIVFLLKGQFIEPKRLDVGAFCNGILSGLVAITAGCASVRPWEAVAIGLVGGLVYIATTSAMQRLQIDDVVDAFAVHGASGFWGIMSVGLFGDPADGIGGNGAFYGGDQLGIQCVAVLCMFVWVACLSTLVLLSLRFLGLLRLSLELQDAGADVIEHSPPKAYSSGEGSNGTALSAKPDDDAYRPKREMERSL